MELWEIQISIPNETHQWDMACGIFVKSPYGYQKEKRDRRVNYDVWQEIKKENFIEMAGSGRKPHLFIETYQNMQEHPRILLTALQLQYQWESNIP